VREKVERKSGRVDARPRDFTGFDAAPEGNRVHRVGAGIDDGSKTGVGQHLLQFSRELSGGQLRGIRPLWLHEVNMRVPETGKHDATTAVEGFDCRRHRKLAAHGGNFSVAN
jgi:hypothetical protein